MAEIDASFWMTLWWPSAEKPRPPYSFGMIIPKNLFFFRYSHTCGSRSAWTWVVSQSLVILQTSSTGPSRKACSSAVSVGFGCASRSAHFGAPEKSSPSKPTVPASSAVFSVSESGGRILV